MAAGALRRAILNALKESMEGAGDVFSSDQSVGRGLSFGGLSGIPIGGAVGAIANEDDRSEGAGMGMVGGLLGGAALGGAGGVGVKALRTIGGGMNRGLYGLRSALREGMENERVPMEMAEEVGDRFIPGQPRQYSLDELNELEPPAPRYGSGQHNFDGGRANPMHEMQDGQAMRNALRQLKEERSMAQSQDELDDIDLQIAILSRDLGLM